MDKSLDPDFLKKTEKIPQAQLNSSPNHARTLFNIILHSDKDDSSKPGAFTPTHKSATLKNDGNTTPSQQRFQQELLFQQEEQGKRLNMVDTITTRITQLESRVSKLERKQARINKSRRIRRKNSEIAKLFSCPVENCSKNYGTETALKKHIQLKHKGEKVLQSMDKEE